MSCTLGPIVLRKVAEHYHDKPRSWKNGAGNLLQIARNETARLPTALTEPDKQGCIHTMIVCYSTMVAGEPGKVAAERDAVRILCQRHNLEVHENSIFNFNDGNECGSVENAIKFVEAALAPAPTQAAESTPQLALTFAPKTSVPAPAVVASMIPAKVLAVAMLGLILAAQLAGTFADPIA